MDDRAAYRNVHFYDASDERLLGGLYQNGSITEANFLDMLNLILVTQSPIAVQDRFSCNELCRSGRPLQPGIYDIRSKGSIKLTKEGWLPRLVCPSYTEPSFAKKVLARDNKCVISGVPDHRVTEATYIFPCDNEDYWLAHNLAQCITDMPRDSEVAKLDSPQNGITLLPHIRQMWDQYLIAVNPDDNYKVTVFGLDIDGLDGRKLDPACHRQSDPQRASDALLRWHYRQAVLANLRGEGEPLFECALGGADALRALQCGPYAKERFQMEVAVRLRGFVGGEARSGLWV